MPRHGEETRRKIIDTAYEVFYKGGFARAGVDAIADAAGMSRLYRSMFVAADVPSR